MLWRYLNQSTPGLLPMLMPDDGANTSGGGNDSTADDQSGNTNADTSGGEQDGDDDDTTGGDAGGTAITFPDERSFMSRVKREAQQQVNAVLADLGVDSVDTAKDRLQKLKDREEAELSETERLQNALTEREQKIVELEQQSTTQVQDYQQRISDLRIEVEASRQSFNDPADAVRMIDRASLEYDDDGNPTNVAALLEGLAKEKPYLIAQHQNNNGVPPAPKPGDSRMTEEERRQMAYKSRL